MSGISIIAGLGNPGRQYEGTRHNVGFAVLDEFVARCGTLKVQRREPDAEIACGMFGEHELWFIKPMSFMNRSGEPIGRMVRGQGKDVSSLLVIHDELDLTLGTVRLKVGGGEGGHNGLRSISVQAGGNGYNRLRVGIGRPTHPDWEIHRWVLSRFADEEKAAVTASISQACDAIEAAVHDGMKAAQNRFNSEMSKDR